MATEYYGECPFCDSPEIDCEFVDSEIVSAGALQSIHETYLCTCLDCGEEFETRHVYDYSETQDDRGNTLNSINDVKCSKCGNPKLDHEHSYWRDKDGYTENHYDCYCPRCGSSTHAKEIWMDAGSLLIQTFESDRKASFNRKSRW